MQYNKISLPNNTQLSTEGYVYKKCEDFSQLKTVTGIITITIIVPSKDYIDEMLFLKYAREQFEPCKFDYIFFSMESCMQQYGLRIQSMIFEKNSQGVIEQKFGKGYALIKKSFNKIQGFSSIELRNLIISETMLQLPSQKISLENIQIQELSSFQNILSCQQCEYFNIKNVTIYNVRQRSGDLINLSQVQQVSINGLNITYAAAQTSILQITDCNNLKLENIHYYYVFSEKQSGAIGVIIEIGEVVDIKNYKIISGESNLESGCLSIRNVKNSVKVKNLTCRNNQGTISGGILAENIYKFELFFGVIYSAKGALVGGLDFKNVHQIKIHDLNYQKVITSQSSPPGINFIINQSLSEYQKQFAGNGKTQFIQLQHIRLERNQDMSLAYPSIIVQNYQYNPGSYFKNITAIDNQAGGIDFQNTNNINMVGVELIRNTKSENLKLINCQNIMMENIVIKNEKMLRFSGFICTKCENVQLKNSNLSESNQQMVIINNSKKVILSNININKNNQEQLSQDGGAISIYEGEDVRLEQLTINNNIAMTSGGAIFLKNCKRVQLISVKLNNNRALNSGGALFAFNITDISLKDIEFKNNNGGLQGGAAVFQNANNITIDKIIVQENIVSKDTGGFSFIHSQYITITNGYFYSNNAERKAANINFQDSTNIVLSNLDIAHGRIPKSGGGVSILSSKIIMVQKIVFYNNTSIEKYGGAIYISDCEQVTLSSLDFFKNSGQNGGALAIADSSNIQMEKLQFLDNQASLQGGGLYMIENKNVNIFNITVKNNKAVTGGGGGIVLANQNFTINGAYISYNEVSESSGGGLYIIDRCRQVSLFDITFSRNKAPISGANLHMGYIDNIQLTRVSLDKGIGSVRGQGIYLQQNNNVTIKDSLISNNQNKNAIADYGAALYAINIYSLQIINTKIYNNKSQKQGGGAYLFNVTNILIQKSFFSYNLLTTMTLLQNLEVSGGGLYINNSTLLSIQGSSVSNSLALVRGGGIIMLNIKDVQIEESSFSNNKVKFDKNIPLYWKDVNYIQSQGGSIYYEPIVELKQVSQIKHDFKFEMKNCLFQSSEASSGGGIMINLKQKQTKVNFQFQNSTFEKCISDVGPALRILGNQSLENNFTFMFKDNIGLLSNKSQFEGYYRNERILGNGDAQFTLCEKGSFLQVGGSEICQKCDQNGVCEGGYVPTYPKKNYWRTNKQQTKIVKCDNSQNTCLGNDTCKIGYTGVLCENCDIVNDYALSKGKCLQCGNRKYVYINIGLLFLVSVFILANQIYGVNKRISKRLVQKCFNIIFDFPMHSISQLSGITKIFIMHCQIIYLVATYNLEFPFQVTKFAEVLGNPHKMFSSSLNCLIMPSSQKYANQVGYNLAIFGLLLTIGTIVFVLLFEIVIYFASKLIQEKQQLYSYFKCSFLCFFLTVQPGLLQNSLQFVTCKTVAGIKYSIADTNIKCDSEFYKKHILPINLVVVLLMGFIIPLFIAYLLYMGKKTKVFHRIMFQRNQKLEIRFKINHLQVNTSIQMKKEIGKLVVQQQSLSVTPQINTSSDTTYIKSKDIQSLSFTPAINISTTFKDKYLQQRSILIRERLSQTDLINQSSQKFQPNYLSDDLENQGISQYQEQSFNTAYKVIEVEKEEEEDEQNQVINISQNLNSSSLEASIYNQSSREFSLSYRFKKNSQTIGDLANDIYFEEKKSTSL